MMNQANAKRIAAAGLLVSALLLGAYNFRAFVPAGSYTARLVLLQGWSSQGYYGFNCAGFITNAHSSAYMSERAMYAGGKGQMHLVAEFASRYTLDETKLQVGDVAAYRGRYSFEGQHVAVYMGHGTWIDSDSRRGHVATYRLQDVPSNDEWFMGTVRIQRWNQAGSLSAAGFLHFFDAEQKAINEQ